MSNPKLIIAILLALIFFSCTEKDRKTNNNENIPAALNDNITPSVSSIVSKRGYREDDILQQLYNELVEKSPKLKKLEEVLTNMPTAEQDSTSGFKKFDSKNKSYFNAIDEHLKSIKDSAIKEEIHKILVENIKQYNQSIAKDTTILNLISKNNEHIADLHILLRIVSTLPLMQKYQKENHPNSKSMEEFSEHQKTTIKSIDSLLTK